MAWKLNRGEWSEAYVFCKLLAEGKMYAGDENLKKNDDVYIDILKCIRRNEGIQTEFERIVEDDGRVDYVVFSQNREHIEITQLNAAADQLLTGIKNGKGKSFELPDSEKFLHDKLGIHNIKEKCVKNSRDDKTDILFETFNSANRSKHILGFSIKSHLGKPATLFNFSSATRLVYKVDGCDEKMMHCLNAQSNLKKRIGCIKNSNDLSLTFMGSKNQDNKEYGGTKESGPFFTWNLEHLDLSMLKVFDCMLLSSYGYLDVKPRTSSLKDIVDAVAKINPLKVHCPETVYVAKFKEFLYCAFAGLTGSKKWDGTRHINGGYIDVKKNGEILFYSAVSDDQFMSFLFNNMRLENPEHGSCCKYAVAEANQYLYQIPIPKEVTDNKFKDKKGDYGYVYKVDSQSGDPYYCLDINFSFRFKK